jgi:uncharacterized protein with ATP-grasp and redox domains
MHALELAEGMEEEYEKYHLFLLIADQLKEDPDTALKILYRCLEVQEAERNAAPIGVYSGIAKQMARMGHREDPIKELKKGLT